MLLEFCSLECGIWFVGIISVVYMPFQFSCLLMSFRCVQKVSDKNYKLENVSDGVENVTDVQCEDVRKNISVTRRDRLNQILNEPNSN